MWVRVRVVAQLPQTFFVVSFGTAPFQRFSKTLILDFEANSAASFNCTFFRFESTILWKKCIKIFG